MSTDEPAMAATADDPSSLAARLRQAADERAVARKYRPPTTLSLTGVCKPADTTGAGRRRKARPHAATSQRVAASGCGWLQIPEGAAVPRTPQRTARRCVGGHTGRRSSKQRGGAREDGAQPFWGRSKR